MNILSNKGTETPGKFEIFLKFGTLRENLVQEKMEIFFVS
jgi:hypothetical protein